MIPIRKASKELGIHASTLRRWEAEGKLVAQRTVSGHRRYDVNQIKALVVDNAAAGIAIAPAPTSETTFIGAIYCRVSSSKQRGDLMRQQVFMQHQFPTFELYSDVASGTNYNRPGLQRLLERIIQGTVTKVAAASKDRIGRFGFDLFAQVCQLSGVELIIVESDDSSPQEELADDIISVVTSFAARAHGLRKYRIGADEELQSETYTAASAADLQAVG